MGQNLPQKLLKKVVKIWIEKSRPILVDFLLFTTYIYAYEELLQKFKHYWKNSIY